jgi:anti-sigma B factor antagonist
MDVNVRTQNGISVVAVHGDLDSTSAGPAQRHITEVVSEARDLAIDLSDVEYLSSAGLRVLLLLYRQSQALGINVVLVGVSSDLAAVMRATGFLDFFRTADSVAAAVRLLRVELAP